MSALKTRKAELEALLADKPDTKPLRLHPALAKRFAEKVAQLEDTLKDPAEGDQAAELIRGTIDCILLTPTQARLNADLHGDLAVILDVCEEAEDNKKTPRTKRSRESTVGGCGGAQPALFAP